VNSPYERYMDTCDWLAMNDAWIPVIGEIYTAHRYNAWSRDLFVDTYDLPI
jgi:hypothetical protein